MNVQRIASSLVRRGVVPLTPQHKRLAVLAWSNRRFEGGEPELEKLHRIVPAGCRTAVDAGANLGFYSLRLSALARSVYAFEINRLTTEYLESARLPNVRIVHMGLSDSDRNVTLYVPMHAGRMPLYGWASLNQGNCPDTNVHTELPGQVRPLDSYGLKDVDFMKIDVEGHELQLLQGARETLARFRPRILAEAKNLQPVADFLSDLGYRAVRADEFGVKHSPAWMHVFEPH